MSENQYAQEPKLTFYQEESGLWKWRIYSVSGEIISQSLQGHETHDQAERDAGKSLAAIIAVTMRTAAEHLGHMTHAVAYLIDNIAETVDLLTVGGYINRTTLKPTQKGKRFIDADNFEEVRESEQRQLDSAYTPSIKVSTPIPVQYADQPQIVAVRVK